ncbi:hypothetical protein [Luteibaculum oceani]|uniref:DUF4382 domain-containing protein n=1 Tax=Luteibaculum oceani TaxID=1294296 RepID=A0A5C6VI69_9FLAO|nr:hypothetical protein [Luteibaculum oceani]TXC85172.1 hypothetical protein FRX97_00700 [Luteibaculum oceani]
MKKLKVVFPVLLALVLSSAVVSCKKDEATEPNSQPQVAMKFKSNTEPFPVASAQEFQALSFDSINTLAFDSGYITLVEVEFQVQTGDDSVLVDFNLEQNIVIDFATGQTSPDISAVEIPAGIYSEVEVELELQDEGDEPGMVLFGSFVDTSGTSHKVRFEFNSGETFEVEKEGNVVFAVNQSVLTTVTFDPSAWFAGVKREQLIRATRDGNGVIVISETRNSEIFDIVADGLDLATEVEVEVD